MSAAVAAAARDLVGVRFRLHGRDPAHGLDCIGLVGCALAAAGWRGAIPSGYPLRGGDPASVAARLDRLFSRAADDRRPGDMLIVCPGAAQLHLIVASTAGFVHADAALRRVVEQPGEPPWPVLGAWRWEGN